MPPSTTTRATLLARVRDGTDAEAWGAFDHLYRELILRFCRARGIQHADCEDIVQLVFTKLSIGIKRFEYDPAKGRFRDYLFRCVRSAISDLLGEGCPNHAPGPVLPESKPGLVGDDRALAAAFEREWIDHHFRLALAAVESRVDEQSMRVLRSSLNGMKPTEIAVELEMTADAVYKALQRMRARLRGQVAEQVRDEESLHG